MSQSTIMQRLTMLTAVPVIALIFSSGLLVWDSFSRYHGATQSKILMQLSVAAGEVIHPMQVERGMTSGFLQSKGREFADKLPGQREKTDAKLADFRQVIAGIDIGAMPQLKKAADELSGKLEKLSATREKINQNAIPAGEAIGYFTATIAGLMDMMSTSAGLNKDPEIAKKLLTYHAFVNAKENAGQERALTVAAFVANKVEPAQFRNILRKVYAQENYLNTFQAASSEQEKTSLKAVLDGEGAKEVRRMRGIIVDRSDLGGFDIDPSAWFKNSTAMINGLHEVEQLLTKNINENVNHVLSASRAALIMQLSLAAIAIAIAIAVSLWVGRGVSRPLRMVVDAAEFAVANDDFSRNLPEEGTIETARVAQAINELMEKFRLIIEHATLSSADIADASAVLATASGDISRSSIAQSDAASAVAAAVEEISVSVSETALSAGAAAEIVEKSGARTVQVLGIMKETVNNVNNIATLIRKSDSDMAELDERSKKIGGIVEVIKEVADQTNLLALNAAIEAARAGEQGRGFAVVADEVRKLAERTSKATSEIAELIADIQSHIGGSVTGMQQANVQVAESLKLVGKTESELRHIGDDAREVGSNVQSIADAIREQDAAIQQVAANIEKIAQMAEENSIATASSSKTALKLDSLSCALKDTVVHFKVS